MKLRNKIVLGTIAIMLLLSLFLAWSYPSAQDLMPGNPFWNGLSDFSRIAQAEMRGSLDRVGTPQNTVLIAISYTPYRSDELERIKQFILDGGIVAILDDFGQGNSILTYLGLKVRFSGSPMLDPLFNFKNSELPKVTAFEGRLKEKGLGSVLLNRPSVLLNVETFSVLALSSETSFLDTNRNRSPDRNEPRGPFPVAAEMSLSKGKLVLISDASMVSNSMIGQDDNYRFLEEVLGLSGKYVIIDGAHIPNSTLDRAKRGLAQTRSVLSGYYPLTILVLAVLALALRPLWIQRNIQGENRRKNQTN